MSKFERRVVNDIVSMSNDELLGHIAHYRGRARELHSARRFFESNAADADSSISADIASFDRMVAILEGTLT